VGKAFVELIHERRVPLSIAGAADSRGAIAREVEPRGLLELKSSGALPAEVDPAEVIARTAPDVVVDLMSCDLDTGEPSLTTMFQALESGASVATATKAPLARHWAKLWEAAQSSGVSIGYAGAAGAALPAVAVARALARVDTVGSFEGVLTGTTTFVLEEMSGGATLEDAVAAAQAAGIAEPDPSVDIGGWDTAAKLVILANTLWDETLDLDQVHVTGLSDDLPERDRDGRIRLIGEAVRSTDAVRLNVEPRTIPTSHPLGRLAGRDKGVLFRGPAIGEVMVAGGSSSPRGAAASVMGDVLELGGMR